MFSMAMLVRLMAGLVSRGEVDEKATASVVLNKSSGEPAYRRRGLEDTTADKYVRFPLLDFTIFEQHQLSDLDRHCNLTPITPRL